MLAIKIVNCEVYTYSCVPKTAIQLPQGEKEKADDVCDTHAHTYQKETHTQRENICYKFIQSTKRHCVISNPMQRVVGFFVMQYGTDAIPFKTGIHTIDTSNNIILLEKRATTIKMNS